MIELYKNSYESAQLNSETGLWLDSFNENKRCAEFIKNIIDERFDGYYLPDSCLTDTIAEFGRERTEWVLANTINNIHVEDIRVSRENHKWALHIGVPDSEKNRSFAVKEHSGLVNLMVDQYRKLEPEITEGQKMTM